MGHYGTSESKAAFASSSLGATSRMHVKMNYRIQEVFARRHIQPMNTASKLRCRWRYCSLCELVCSVCVCVFVDVHVFLCMCEIVCMCLCLALCLVSVWVFIFYVVCMCVNVHACMG